ncbi:MAG: SMP-30/gluconolactonase/LRE family protein [Hyphomonadaceae bacterium]|nr:SMP-30/gluconolactonase/LRE family protein [Hyphomonadaceae bacterium]
MRLSLLLAGTAMTLMLSACSVSVEMDSTETIGSIDRRTTAMDSIVAPDAQIEVLARGFTWPEGPVWVEEDQALFFNDVPENKMYRWTAATGSELFLTPSGGATEEMAKIMREPGANGIIEWSGAPGKLLLADHGARGLSVLDPDTRERETIVSSFEGQSLNSPNDIVERSDGALFFTDPPYGLKGLNEAPEKELPHNGVYLLQDGEPAQLVIDDLSFPNGIGLSPDESTLYVAVSDPENAVIMAYDTGPDGTVANGRVLFNAIPELKEGGGLPDGMDIARDGTIFATGPDGVYVIAPDTGEIIGVISTGMATSNCTLDDAEEYLYMTSSSVLARVPLNLD